jgi:hypothetical protein
MTRRMTVIVLSLVGLMVLIATVSPPDRGTRGGSGTRAKAIPAPTAPLSDPYAFDVSAELSAAPGVASKTVDAEVGDRVEITVEGTGPDSVSLEGLAMKTVDADSPARFELLADTPGRYPIVLLNESRQIGALEVR